MSADKYFEIFEDLLGKYLRDSIIYKYGVEEKNHKYTPFRHHYDKQTEKTLGNLMKKYIFMYAYSEEEVIKAYSKGRLKDLEKASEFALTNRLPNRRGATNGLYSELLLDLLITLHSDEVNKLATRAIYRQNTDNQEIKGFDSLHISVDKNDNKSIWLGQAKMGDRSYCIRDIKKDLNEKANIFYTADQLFFVADKETKTLKKALELLEDINDINWDYKDKPNKDRAAKLNKFFTQNNIKLVLPCLLAYGRPNIYEKEEEIDNEMKKELEKIVEKYEKEFKGLLRCEYEILVWFIPIRDLKLLRESMEV